MKPIGHYAYQITWNDGHATGIPPVERAAELGETQNDQPKNPNDKATMTKRGPSTFLIRTFDNCSVVSH